MCIRDRRRTATISRGEPCPETSWKPLGQRTCGSWSPGRFGTWGLSRNARRARARLLLAGAGSTTTRATRIAPMSAADTSQKTAFWKDDA
eukprot:9328387-Alexandrium_andersonii.AAC.1